MSIKNGVWHHAEQDPPGAEYINKSVLVVREFVRSRNNTYRIIDFGIYNAIVINAPGWTLEGKWNKKNVIYWMPLPEIPED